MNFCPKCHSTIEEDRAKYCHACGSILQTEAKQGDIEVKDKDGETRGKEQLFRKMFEEHHSIMLLIERSGRIVDANPAAANFYGYSRERLRQMNISDINQLSSEQEG